MAKAARRTQVGAYWLPNLLTTFNLVCGILATLLAIENYSSGQATRLEDYAVSAWLLLAAMLFDFLDGKVARWTNAVSDFGVKIDSLSDFVSFGIGPVVIAYTALLPATSPAIQIGACFLFLLAGAFRLARFNTECETGGGQQYFCGLPIPAASALICTVVLMSSEPAWAGAPPLVGQSLSPLPPAMASTLSAFLLVALAGLMMSRIPFPAFKRFNRRNLIILGGAAIFFGVLSLLLALGNILFLIMSLYVFIGLYQYFLDRVIRQHQPPRQRGKRPSAG